MKKYLWAVVSDLLVVGIIIAIFSNVYDTNTTKILAAIMLAYLAVVNATSALSLQAGTTALASLRMFLHQERRVSPTAGLVELKELEDELDTLTAKQSDHETKRLIHAGFNVCIAVAMVLILIG